MLDVKREYLDQYVLWVRIGVFSKDLKKSLKKQFCEGKKAEMQVV